MTTKHTEIPAPARGRNGSEPRPGPTGPPEDTKTPDDGPVAALSLAEEFGGGRLLVSDIRTAFLLLNHARHLTLARLFGVSRDQANLLTLVVVMMLADVAHEKIQALLTGPAFPTLGDGLLAGGGLREVLSGIAGAPARDTPGSGTLLTIAVVGGLAGPAAVKSFREIRAATRGIDHAFRHRYGYLVDPGHWRQRRAMRRERARENKHLG